MNVGVRRGFTLMEISVVLVIIGLMVGGVLTGREMINASRDRSLIREAEAYKEAVHTFQMKYAWLPGDIKNPGKYWPATTWTGGNSDGLIIWADEGPEAWKQIQLSGIIPVGDISISCVAACVATPGTNIPQSAYYPTAGWTIGINKRTVKNTIMFGAKSTSTPASYIATEPVLTPAQLLSIDTKMDDGLPITGLVQTFNVSTWTSNCYTGTTYNASQTTPACNFDFALGL